MFSQLKSIIHRTSRSLGIEIKRYDPVGQQTKALVASLGAFDIDLVLDVGANAGQFAAAIRRGGYLSRIVSFEPLSAAHAALQRIAAPDALWTVHPRCALGNSEGTVSINVAQNSWSSSIRPMLAAHSEVAPDSRYVATETVGIITLDSVYFHYSFDKARTFLKIDTQGFEAEVLDGAVQSLPFLAGIQLEMSLVPLYEGQCLWEHFLERLRDCGFTLWSLAPAFVDARKGRTLQLDATFFRVAE